jgi:PAS domain S-box-containing protein
MHLVATGKAEEVLEGLNFTEVLRDTLTCAIVAVDHQLRITACNPEAQALTGRDATELLRQPASTLPAPFAQLVQETFATGQAIQDRHIAWPGGPQAERTVRVSTAPVQGPDGKVAGVVAVLNDLTAARRVEHNMRRLDLLASVGTLTASMAHEIKNALVAVKTFVDLLLKHNKEAELADIVSREMRRIDSIVSQMLKCAGPAKPTFAAVRLHDVLDQSLALIELQLEGRKISLHRSYRAAPETVRGDAYQLQQTFMNLFFNAIEAMGPGGQLRVSTEFVPADAAPANSPAPAPAPQVRVTVQDTGVGVPPENLGRLFEPFFTTKPNGTGLGLSIARRIIQEHRGTIVVQSEPNRGTTFTILLPAAQRGR